MKSAADLVFDEETHTYRLDGRVVPGVTTVLQLLDDSLKFVDPEVLAAAAEFGTHVHQAVHLDNIGELDEDTLDPDIAPYLDGWRQFVYEHKFVVTESERRVFHPEQHYAGTLDTTGISRATRRRGGSTLPWLVDVKTGTAIPKTVGPQTAAYAAAHSKLRHDRFVVLLKPYNYDLKPLRDPHDESVFRAALTCYRWRHGL